MTAFPRAVPFATPEWLPTGLRPDDQSYFGGPLTSSRGVVFHVNAGNGDPRNWWTNPTNKSVASAHLQIMKSGELRQYVGLDTVAWAECAGNSSWHSVETEGMPSEPLTAAQFETFAKLLAWGHGACGWQLQITDSPDGFGLGTHQMGGAAWGGHACPGPIRAAQRPALLARAQQLLGQPTIPTPQPAPAPVFDVAAWRVAEGGTDPHLAALQAWANHMYPAYRSTPIAPLASHYGPQTVAFVAEFAARIGIRGADGRNIGPQIAAALARAGFGG